MGIQELCTYTGQQVCTYNQYRMRIILSNLSVSQCQRQEEGFKIRVGKIGGNANVTNLKRRKLLVEIHYNISKFYAIH